MRITLVKTNYFSSLWFTSAEGHLTIWRHSMTDASYFKLYAETKNNGSEREVFMKKIQFRPWLRPCGSKVWSFIIQKFSRYFSLSFNVSNDAVRMFLSCSMIVIFPWLLKSWSCCVFFRKFHLYYVSIPNMPKNYHETVTLT